MSSGQNSLHEARNKDSIYTNVRMDTSIGIRIYVGTSIDVRTPLYRVLTMDHVYLEGPKTRCRVIRGATARPFGGARAMEPDATFVGIVAVGNVPNRASIQDLEPL